MLPATVSIFLATASVDLRRSFDTLAATAREQLGLDPMSGVLVVFYNRARDRLKILWRDRTGFCLLHKKLDRGLFRIPDAIPPDAKTMLIDAKELAAILEGVDLPRARLRPRDIAREARNVVLIRRSGDDIQDPA
jgi:transposase